MTASDSTFQDDMLPADELTLAQSAVRARLDGTNIDPNSFLATDYLNHFNEAFMLLGMAADMPDMLDELADWQPQDYEAHFNQTGFPHKALAIKAYRLAPQRIRARFDATTARLSKLMQETIVEATRLHRTGASEDLAAFLEVRCETLRQLHGELNAIIHGGRGRDASEILPEHAASEGDPNDDCADQAAIDALFD